ncbi:Serine--tRNA ligase [Anatilimnocola aggregata]|uniref:Serine--tRNA ligase n=1 Tax=Anatilimnocola aggregata TaxID=2528021 RepID=A0A517YFX9_9BACT|nr:serine--tRNA ligase [Anatilimnocola aggregata]QDU29145.1 Serine--tRNA ligase [Anatilimnocola aggregata]
MLDRKFIVENADKIIKNCTDRGVTCDVPRLVDLETHRRRCLTQVEELNRQANDTAKQIGKADPATRETLKEEGRKLRDLKDQAQAEHDRLETQIHALQLTIPNLTHPAAPIGGEHDAAEVKRGITPIRKLDFKPLDHVELAEKYDLIDFEAGSRTTGHGFYFLKNEAVLIELALQRYVLDILMRHGFTITTTPDLARDEILIGIGFNPRGSAETQIYSIENSDLSLVGTAEITLGGMYSKQLLTEEQLPIKLCGISHCFRTEAGAHGKATRGIYRVHQFTKVEMFAFTAPEESDATLEQLMAIECEIFDGLGIPYRVIDTASGDLGGPAYRKYDLEAWMPGRNNGQGEWGEVTSTSNCTDYQSRRLDVRYKKKTEKGTHFVHTLNGTAVAISRAMIAVLENYQQADGTIAIPDALRTWVGKDRIVPRAQ